MCLNLVFLYQQMKAIVSDYCLFDDEVILKLRKSLEDILSNEGIISKGGFYTDLIYAF